MSCTDDEAWMARSQVVHDSSCGMIATEDHLTRTLPEYPGIRLLSVWLSVVMSNELMSHEEPNLSWSRDRSDLFGRLGLRLWDQVVCRNAAEV